MVCGACVLFFTGADKGSVLHAGNIVYRSSVKIAVRKQILVQFDHFAGLNSLCLKGSDLLFRPVNPHNLGRLEEFNLFIKPCKEGWIFGKISFHIYSPL